MAPLRMVAENDPPAVEPLGVLAVNMPKQLAESIRRLAEANDRSVHAEIRRALREHVEREREGVRGDGID